MDRKEQIIYATLKLASINGLGNVSLQMIADEVGIRKASLFNHFKSKDEIISSMYEFLRFRSKVSLDPTLDLSLSAAEILYEAYCNYKQMCTNSDMFLFYKLIYSERAFNNEARRIVIEETNKMIKANRELLKYLVDEKKLYIKDINYTALQFTATIHQLLDYSIDKEALGEENDLNVKDYIENFVKEHSYEK